jgi:hypothetical protein
VSPIKAKLVELAPEIFKDTPVLFAYLYGSYAGGSPHKFSDLDIGVFVEGLATADCLDLELSLALRFDERLDHVVQSEIRIINQLPLVVKGRLLTDGALIYSVAEGQRIEFECRVRQAYFDFLPILHAYNKSFRQQVLNGLR